MRRRALRIALPLIFISLFYPALRVWAGAVHHDLQVKLLPDEHRLVATDLMTVRENHSSSVAFFLSQRVTVKRVEVGGESVYFSFKDGQLRLPLPEHHNNQALSLRITYEGTFDDPVPVLPVNTDNPGYGVSGTISELGCFLQAGAGWYPQIPWAQTTFLVRVEAPSGIIAVTAGKSLGHQTWGGRTVSTWEVRQPVEGVSLSAARYVVGEKMAGRVKVATYFLPESEHLSQAYLEATARYISLYEGLFGPYPFDKFAVVENFFPTGYGFPSYTLLGSQVLRLPFIIQTSLGHEIAHCWWGNGVYVDDETGNWSEGLTTYVADYLYKEMNSPEDAREYRLELLRNFSTLVPPESDFPLMRFRSRYDPVSKAIGYDKGAMVFHMLRRLVGDDTFWSTLKEIYKTMLFQRVSWYDFQRAFERRENRSLKTFFDQWVSRPGAPYLSLENITREEESKSWGIRGEVAQKRPFYELETTLLLETAEKKILKKLNVSEAITPFGMTSELIPNRIILDPDFDILRRLSPEEIPPSINRLKSAPSVLILLAEDCKPEIDQVVRIFVLSLGIKYDKVLKEIDIKEKDLAGHDILLIGFPQNKVILSKLPEQIGAGKAQFTLARAVHAEPSDIFFGVITNPWAKNRVLALFLPVSCEDAETVARKVTHYGKYSYLVFHGTKNELKGIWPISKSPMVYQWENLTLHDK